jgi:hypothetical protein
MSTFPLQRQPLDPGDHHHRQHPRPRRREAGAREALDQHRAPALVDLGDRAADLGIDDRDRREVEVDPGEADVVVEHPVDAVGGGADDPLDVVDAIELLEDDVGDRLGDRPSDLGDQALLRAVVVGDQALRLARARGDLGEAGSRVALGLHHLERRLEDPLAGAGRGAAAAGGCGRLAQAAAPSIAGSSPIAASFFDSDFAA